jgi:hypothetical protein
MRQGHRRRTVSRHHILPPIIYTPAPPKPKQTRRRRGVGYAKGTSEVDETGETSEAAERRIPSTTGKLSESTLKELLLAQEQDSAPGIGGAMPAAKA